MRAWEQGFTATWDEQIGVYILNGNRPLHDPITWYKMKYTGEQVAQWDFQNKDRSRWDGMNCIVLEVLLRNLLTSIFNFVPCDAIMQRAYCNLFINSPLNLKQKLLIGTCSCAFY